MAAEGFEAWLDKNRVSGGATWTAHDRRCNAGHTFNYRSRVHVSGSGELRPILSASSRVPSCPETGFWEIGPPSSPRVY